MRSQVIKFEKILNESEMILGEVEKALDKLEQNQKEYCELKQYYGSEEYRKDVEISDCTDEYKDIAHGVLSEDAVYDLIGSSYSTYIRMLELAARLLKEH